MPLVSLIFVYWNLLSIGVLVFWLLCISGDVFWFSFGGVVVIAVVFSVHTSSALLLHFVKTGALEDKRKQFLQATPGIQKCFRGLQSRSYFCELKNGVTTL
ncbi:transmembrane protein, putative [Medicago truncatula]|uniref:Transmembrane protein, putative n=1 Tax=Medicago truncatula TaxID=3880 RepID=A0A072UHI4_MEDTR|nr:transmembrane protein, putative [Medicago truncatula]